MPVNSVEKKFFETLFKNISEPGTKPLNEKSLCEFRSEVSSIIWLLKKTNLSPFVENSIQARDGYHIPIRIFNHHLPIDTPLIIYLLGNGFIFEQFEVNTLICSRIANYSNYRVIIANPRLAPENPLPIPILDYFDIVKSIFSRDNKLELAPQKSFLVGYCTGASVALTVSALKDKDEFSIDRLILLNGIYDLTFQHKEYAEYENQDVSFSREILDFITHQQNTSDSFKNNPLYSPLLNNTFDHLPPTTILVGEHDRNRSSSEALYLKMKQRGADVTRSILPGQTHNTIIFYESIADGIDPAKVIAESCY